MVKSEEILTPLSVWTVYKNPSDYPGLYVARLSEDCIQTSTCIIADTLDEVRELIPNGLHCVVRHPDDFDFIVETWI